MTTHGQTLLAPKAIVAEELYLDNRGRHLKRDKPGRDW